ncbi:MAG TPA: hypothetical protein VMF13_13715 [Luteitalea sp.]|nr:hypothetical protein [Luteitalea sp.]
MPDPKRIIDPRIDGVRPDVLRNRTDRPVSVTSPALEWAAIQAAAIANPFGRALWDWEFEIVHDIFQSSLDASRIRIVETRVMNAPTTLGNQIRVSPGWTFEKGNKPVLVHECAHVWQYQTRGTSYITDSVYHNASGAIATGNRNVAYMNYQLTAGSSIYDFTAEEQATIVGDYYEMTKIYTTDPKPDWVNLRSRDMAIYERLIAQVRSARPQQDSMIYQQSLMNQPQPGMDFTSPGTQGFAPVMPLLEIRFRGL